MRCRPVFTAEKKFRCENRRLFALRFTKMQGLGNDYIYLDCTKAVPEDLPGLAERISDRHFGVGGDGLICVCPSERADFCMRMFNADGSEGEMCGNGIRCVGKFVFDKGLTNRRELSIETRAGIKQLDLTIENGQAVAATVDMGSPEVGAERVLTVGEKSYTITPVSMGNPHAVVYFENVDDLDLERLGPGFERHPSFPNRTNTEFVEVLDRAGLNMRVWERGSGETLACGTGACAAAAASAAAGLTGRTVSVHLRGGVLAIRWSETDNHIYMTGPAVTVFEGEWPG